MLKILVFLAGLLMAVPAMAQEDCRASWAEGAAYFKENHMKVVELTVAQRQAVNADFNEEVGAQITLSHAYTVSIDDGAGVAVILVSGDDCVVAIAKMTIEHFTSIISRHST